MSQRNNKICHKLLIFSILFFVTSLFISAVSVDDMNAQASVEQEKTFNHIQVQQKEIHKKLVHIESQLTTR